MHMGFSASRTIVDLSRSSDETVVIMCKLLILNIIN